MKYMLSIILTSLLFLASIVQAMQLTNNKITDPLFSIIAASALSKDILVV